MDMSTNKIISGQDRVSDAGEKKKISISIQITRFRNVRMKN